MSQAQAQAPKTRGEDLAKRKLVVERASINTTALLKILKQASSDTSHRGWGKLLGYFDTESNTLEIKDTYGLLLPKNDERMRKEDVIDEAIKKNSNLFSCDYRQVGFFIFSEDNDIFTYSILNYIINNEKFGATKVFLHFSIPLARIGKNPFKVYEVSDAINQLLLSKKIDNDKSYYELNEEPILDFDLKKDSLFREVPFEVVQSNVFKRFVLQHSEALVPAESRVEKAKFADNVTQNLNEIIHQHAGHIQNLIQNKKTQKKATIVNLFGSYERIRNTLDEKRELVKEIDVKMGQIEARLR